MPVCEAYAFWLTVTAVCGRSNLPLTHTIYCRLSSVQGTLDPWSLLGPTTNYTGNPSIITVVIEQGAHHLDLRAATPGDPQSVIDARNIERAAIRSWIAEWNEKAPTAARSS